MRARTVDADGALALETPTSPSDLKIILSGKFLESSQILDGMPFAVHSQHQITNAWWSILKSRCLSSKLYHMMQI